MTYGVSFSMKYHKVKSTFLTSTFLLRVLFRLLFNIPNHLVLNLALYALTNAAGCQDHFNCKTLRQAKFGFAGLAFSGKPDLTIPNQTSSRPRPEKELLMTYKVRDR